MHLSVVLAAFPITRLILFNSTPTTDSNGHRNVHPERNLIRVYAGPCAINSCKKMFQWKWVESPHPQLPCRLFFSFQRKSTPRVNNYVVPTAKKRSALRWNIRYSLANGLQPSKNFDDFLYWHACTAVDLLRFSFSTFSLEIYDVFIRSLSLFLSVSQCMWINR